MDFFTPLTEQRIREMQEYVKTHVLDHQYDDQFDGVPIEQERLRSCLEVLKFENRLPAGYPIEV